MVTAVPYASMKIRFSGSVPKTYTRFLGPPCGNRDVKGKDASITEESIDFIKSSLAMEKAGACSLRASEEFIERDIR
jgi:hypothetical protein